MLHVIYRLLPEDTKPDTRPAWFSKELCYLNFKQCLGLRDFVVMIDGKEPEWMLASDKAIHIDNSDIAQSFMESYRLALSFPEGDWVYFVEDDYLHWGYALDRLENCVFGVTGVDLISLYDHPDRYRNLPEHNLTNGKNEIFRSIDHHWRTIPSTCMTFAASVRCLKDNRDLFEEWKHVDFELFPRLLGLRGEPRPKKYVMVGSIPSLATHCKLGCMAPGWGE